MNRKKSIQLTGQPTLPPKPIELWAGKVCMLYENGNLRYIKSGNIEIIRMIYSAVRDHNWGTIEPIVYDEKITADDNSFTIKYSANYNQNDIAFKATYNITGSENLITFTMRGQAMSSFKKNRIGFCVLHPVKECMGKPCTIIHPDGSKSESQFPTTIAPHQPFFNIKEMIWSPATELNAHLLFSGDIFETEDQRNWTDASFKTYCTPLANPFPVHIKTGDVIEQSVSIKINGQNSPTLSQKFEIKISPNKVPFTHIGIGASSHGILDKKSVTLLKQLGFSHYRVDIVLAGKTWYEKLTTEMDNAKILATPIEVALHIDPNDFSQLEHCINTFKKATLASITLFNTTRKTTDSALLEKCVPLFRTSLPKVKIGAGTDCYFTELNRDCPPTDKIDFLSFSINPQVHAFDNLSLTETLEAQSMVVKSANKLAGGKDIHVSPVTFKKRFNPDATATPQKTAVDQLPDQVDPRQTSQYGAVWTLGSLKYLLESNATSLTLFETVGWRGLMQGAKESNLFEKFPAQKNDIFPLYYIFKWVMEFKNGFVIPTTSSYPLLYESLLLKKNDKKRLLLANMTLADQHILLSKFDKPKSIKTAQNSDAIFNPNKKEITLTPYSTACLDFDN